MSIVSLYTIIRSKKTGWYPDEVASMAKGSKELLGYSLVKKHKKPCGNIIGTIQYKTQRVNFIRHRDQ